MKLTIYKKAFVWRVKLVGGNGETLMFSETYYSKENAKRALMNLSKTLKIGIGK